MKTGVHIVTIGPSSWTTVTNNLSNRDVQSAVMLMGVENSSHVKIITKTVPTGPNGTATKQVS